jgi:lipopolysaccharide/colanic/teichoic acid biosynthesis glycosyltransferase
MYERAAVGLVDNSEMVWTRSAVRETFGSEVTGSASDGTYAVLKRILDIFLASLALLLFAPIMLLASLAIALEDRGPILFVQIRVGKDGKPFPFLKFRSMVRNAEQLKTELAAQNEATGPIFKMRNDPRITRVGRILRKYSIDELPQLLQVLRGEMSLVGPRPHLPNEVRHYTTEQAQRLAVQPGLVCLREVCGRCNLTFERWIELDLQYIQSRSLRTDLSILLRLIPAVLRREGAY